MTLLIAEYNDTQTLVANQHYIIYYTFSTIAQVVAGIISLLGIFIIFRIQEFGTQIKGYGNAFLLDIVESEDKGKKVAWANGIEKYNDDIITNKSDRFNLSRLKKSIEKIHIPDLQVVIQRIVYLIPTTSYKDHFKILCTIIKRRARLLNLTKCFIITGTFIIAISLGILPFNDLFTSPRIAMLISSIGIIFVIIYFIFMAALLLKSFNLDESPSPELSESEPPETVT